jgi:DNA-binding transcriptional LysR family regulator
MLRMSTRSSAAATIVPLAIAGEFRDRFLGVELAVSMVEPPGVLPLPRSGEVDLALCNQARWLEPPGRRRGLSLEEWMLVALPRGDRLAGRSCPRLTELAAER